MGGIITGQQYSRPWTASSGTIPAVARSARLAAKRSIFQPAGLVFSILLLGLICTRIFDVYLTQLHIPMVLFILAGTCAFLNISALRLPSSTVSVLVTAYTCWMAITIPFSVWRAGSVVTIYNNVYALLLYAFFASLITTFKESLRVMYTFGAGSVIAASFALLAGTTETGRLTYVRGIFADPNDFALMLLMGLPFLFLMVARSPVLKKILVLLAIVPVLVVLLRTGSRGGLIALVALMLMLFLGTSVAQKLLIFVGTVAFAILSVVLMPNYLKVRYLSIAMSQPLIQEIDQETLDNLGGAVGSTESRLTLLMASLHMTAQNPVFGVGPGNFPTVMWDQAALRGRRSPWLVTHNTFTQVSSETGIPGLILLLALLYACLKTTNSILKARSPAGSPLYPADVLNAAFFLRICIVSISVGCLFLSTAYTPIIYMLALMAAALQRTAGQEMIPLRINSGVSAHLAPAPIAPWAASGPRLPAQSVPVRR